MSITVWYRNITFLEKNQGVFFLSYTHIVFYNFIVMEPCHSCSRCWQKSDLVRQAVAAICYLHCDSLKK